MFVLRSQNEALLVGHTFQCLLEHHDAVGEPELAARLARCRACFDGSGCLVDVIQHFVQPTSELTTHVPGLGPIASVVVAETTLDFIHKGESIDLNLVDVDEVKGGLSLVQFPRVDDDLEPKVLVRFSLVGQPSFNDQ